MTTSSDGYLTATANTATASIFLTVNFTGGVNAGTITAVTVTRNDGVVVRGLDLASAPAGIVAGLDHEAQLATAFTYTAQGFNAAGTLVLTSTSAGDTISGITVDWLKCLTYPSLSVPVTFQSYPAWDLVATQSISPIVGATNPIVVSDARRTAVSVSSSQQAVLVTGTASDQNNLQTLLSAAGPFLLQTISAANEPDRYVSVGKVTVARAVRIAQDPYRYFTLELTTVARPSPLYARVTRPGHSYANSTATWALYSNRTSTYGSR